MRPVSEQINHADPGWPLVQQWIKGATNPVEVLPVNTPQQAEQALHEAQVTTRSPMGAVVYQTGGLLIDHGWLRILGSGQARLTRSLMGWNLSKSFDKLGERAPFLLIADDVVGGFFALNGGALGNDLGKVYYFAPDRLAWEPLELSYSEFLEFCFRGDLAKFYEGQRWAGWQTEVAQLSGDQSFHFITPLWMEHKDIGQLSRKPVPVEEVWLLEQDIARQLGPTQK